MMDGKIFYLAGPMSSKPYENIPLFKETAQVLRGRGYTIVSPVELDGNEVERYCMENPTSVNLFAGDTVDGNTWGDFLSRDINILSDECHGVILLPDWEESAGAKLEAFLAVLKNYDIRAYYPTNKQVVQLQNQFVLDSIYFNTIRGLA